jgi:hypothetical protein
MLMKKKICAGLILVILVLISILGLYVLRNSSTVGRLIFGLEPGDSHLVLNLTFDDPAAPWKDYSILNHQFSAQGTVRWQNHEICKWNGCADFSDDASDFLNTTSKFHLDNGMSACFWIYLVQPDTGSKPQFYFQIGSTHHLKTIEENQYGPYVLLMAKDGSVNSGTTDSSRTLLNQWTHYCFIYNETAGTQIWRNGELKLNQTTAYRKLNSTFGEIVKIGAGRYDDSQILLDEFLLWNRSIGYETVLEIYNRQKYGTPPALDLYVKAIKYSLPIDWNSQHNFLETGAIMPIRITIANAGTQSSGQFTYTVELEDSAICSGSLSLAAHSETNVTCNWQTSIGFHKGYVSLNVNNPQETNLENNMQRLYIPFVDRPWFHFSLEEWSSNLKPYCSNTANLVAYDSCSWMSTFVSENFNQGWEGNDVDPRAKKGRENAMGCLYNSYNGNNQCTNAIDHLEGWASRPISSFSNVQSIHEIAHVGIMLDIMFPYLSQEQYMELSEKYHDICQHITNLPNTRPDLDTAIIKGDNGQGFGSGMAAFCYALIGLYPENPTLIQNLPDKYSGKNIPDEWMRREANYLQAFKNDSYAQYQEGWLYKTYSQPHLVENWWFQKRHGLNNIEEYQNALCSMGREAQYSLLDYSYNGNTLRNDRDRRFRSINRGDSFSYQHIADGQFADWDILLYYGLLCNEPIVKQGTLWLRDLVYETNEARRTYPSSYLYKLLLDQAEPKSPEEVMERIIFDNANDIFLIRTGYSYVNDTVIQIDGGEEKGSGHSQAQGYFLYALGEPFLDYEQVPYNDDVRSETWKNGISLQNSSQAVEGTSGMYNALLGAARQNQYYGGGIDLFYPEDHPDGRSFPLEYGGDLENYIGTRDANFAGVYAWRPYKNAGPVKEYFVKFGDTLIKRTIVSGVTEGKGIYHNFINVHNEYEETRSSLNFTLKRQNQEKHLATQVLFSSQPLVLGGGETNVNICFSKTSCSGSARGNSKYRRLYYYTAASDLDLIFAHHWYTHSYKAVEAIGNADKGLRQEDNIVIFDTDSNNIASHGTKSASGWALAYNDITQEIGAFNTTWIQADGFTLFESDTPVSVHIKRETNRIIMTINTMERNQYIDFPKRATVTVDAQELMNNADFMVVKNSQIVPSTETGTKVTFDAVSGQNSDEYIITGAGSFADNSPPSIVSITDTISSKSVSLSLLLNESGNATLFFFGEPLQILTSAAYSTGHSFTVAGLDPLTAYQYQINGSDSKGNRYSSPVYEMSTLESSRLPSATKYDGRTTDFETVDIENLLLVLEISEYGRIHFQDALDASDLDFDSHVNIVWGLVEVDPQYLPALDQNAVIYLYYLNFSNPMILKDGSPCTQCSEISYVGGNISFNVPGFSVYSVVQTPSSSGQTSSGGSGSSGGGGSGPPLVRQPDNKTINKTQDETPVLEYPEPEVDEPAILPPSEEIPAPTTKTGTLTYIFISLFSLIVVIAISALLYLKHKEPPVSRQIETIQRLIKGLIKRREEPQPKNKELASLALEVHKMSERDFQDMKKNNSIQALAASVHKPETGALISLMDSKDDAYRLLYNIYQAQSKPGHKPVTKYDEKILMTNMNQPGSPLYLSNGAIIKDLHGLLNGIHTLSEEEYSKVNNDLIQWSMQFGEISYLMSMTRTKSELISLLNSLKAEQQMYRLIKTGNLF